MTKSEQTDEEFYDEEIAPVLLELCKKCKVRKLPFFALAGYDREDKAFGYTKFFDPEHWSDPSELHLIHLCLSYRNIENIGIGFTKYVVANKIEHSSMVLKMLGVEPKVEER